MTKRRSASRNFPDLTKVKVPLSESEERAMAEIAMKMPSRQEAIEPQNEKQKKYIASIKSRIITFATGSAGTGKTFIAGAMAAQALDAHRVKQIIITRPAIEAGESLGFLPGELDEKFDPYLQPFRMVLEERMGKAKVEYLLKSKIIEALPLAYMRGRTFKNCFVILDEAQNTTPKQMKMFLTRIGLDTKVVVNGDTSQVDIQGRNGLSDAVERLSFLPTVGHINFTRDDVVRSGIVSEIIQAYDDPLPVRDIRSF
jgi:phosphate starvation-inducible PhoH-like protein